MKMKQPEPPIDYKVSTVTINTCGQLYQEWREKKRLYRQANVTDGLKLDVEFADTLHQMDDNGHEINEAAPVVLCLHGATRNYKDFTHLIHHFRALGKRVIAPNFPTYDVTVETKVFRHSAQEKKEYVKDFIKAIGLTKIDLIVSHSSSVYPTALLWRDTDRVPIKSIALINPTGHRRIKAMRPKIWTSIFVRLYQKPCTRCIIRMFGGPVLTMTGCPVETSNMDDVILSATTMVYSKFRYLSESLTMMADQQVPILMVLSENDKLVDTDISYEIAELLGATEDNFDVYNHDAQLEKQRKNDTFPWVVVLPQCGHYSFKTQPKIVNETLTEFMDTVNRSIQT